MTNNQDKINELLVKLDSLLKKQEDFNGEINKLRIEVNNLKIAQENEPETTEMAAFDANLPLVEVNTAGEVVNPVSTPKPEPPKQPAPVFNKAPKVKSDVEKFIGENLINKIGIAITVIGVAIGAKYAIDHELISPLTRIILGYLVGIGLLGFAIKLKKNYEQFSAVLLSGAMAIMYFISFAAYTFYELIPQGFAFALMVIFTAFTVVAALKYNNQVIAHVGLVGAYAVPFLLSDGSGRVAILFSYMAIINIGILIIAFKKYWKPLYYVAFGLTWLIYFLWFTNEYKMNEHFMLALIFISVFFTTFYMTFLSYKMIQKEKFVGDDIILLLANSFIFYGIGYVILNDHSTGNQLLGLFTLCNAIVHFIVSVIIYRKKLADKNLFYLVSGLVLVFITITVPVQLDGNWVTLLWVSEAALLYWIGRTKDVPVYEKLAYPLMLLAFFSIMQDWTVNYGRYYPENPESRLTPVFNINFLSSVLFIAAFGFISFLQQNKKYAFALILNLRISNIIGVIIPAILIFTTYNAVRLEISNYWEQLFRDSALVINTNDKDYPDYYWNYDLNSFKTIWIINYTLFFVSALTYFNSRKVQNQQLWLVTYILTLVSIVTFLLLGLYTISELRESYLTQTLAKYYQIGNYNIGIRYISFAFIALVFGTFYKYLRQDFNNKSFHIIFEIVLYTSLIWIISSELIHWMDIVKSVQSYKLGLSILWGTYSLLVIALGIWKRKKHLRIGAIVLFGATLLKLFFYDISHLDTIAKTIVFVSLGILLLIISFLYNKYKIYLSDENSN